MNVELTTKQKGNITEVETMLAFMKLGYTVLTPYGDCDRYDFLVEVNGKFLRMQSKTSSTENNGESIKFSCRSSTRKNGQVVHHQYSNDEIDYFVTSWEGKVYIVPVSECGSDKRLRFAPCAPCNYNKVNWAKDYELEEVVKNW